MADIELVIKIPESMYEGVMLDRVLDTTVIRILDEIKNGTPLPKGHGRLIDADALKSECYSIVDPKGIYSELKIIEDYYIDDAPTIIEANKEEGED